jgi:hypothetical protein
MEFMSRGNHQAQTAAPQGVAAHHAPGGNRRLGWGAKAARIEVFIVLVGGAALLVLVALYVGVSGNLKDNAESKYVNTSEFQAVFLNNGQVYFGKLDNVNSSYFVLDNVYYLQSPSSSTSTTTASSNYTLEKLGVNELHAPEDQMVINRSQVTFWENLKSSGKVVQAIQQYEKNPSAASQVQNTGTTGQASTTTPSSTGTGSSTTQP